MSETLHLVGASSPVPGRETFVFTWREGGQRGAWVRPAGQLGPAGGPLLNHTLRQAVHGDDVFALTGAGEILQIGDLDPLRPAQCDPQLAQQSQAA